MLAVLSPLQEIQAEAVGSQAWTGPGRSQCSVPHGLWQGPSWAGSSSQPLCPCSFSRTLCHQDLWSQGLRHHLGLVLSPGLWAVRASCDQVSLDSSLDLYPHLVCAYILLFQVFRIQLVFFMCRVLVSFSSGCPPSHSSRVILARHCPHRFKRSLHTGFSVVLKDKFSDSCSSCPPSRAASWIILSILSSYLLRNQILRLAKRRDLILSCVDLIHTGFLYSLQPTLSLCP